MNKKVIVLAFSALSTYALANDELPQAPAEEVQLIIETCKEWATEDNVAADDLNEYLLNCVNNDLTNQGFKSIDKID